MLPGKWLKRLCDLMSAQGEIKGRLFRRNLKPARLFEFEHDFYRLLKAVHSNTNLISKEMDVENAYGIFRSTRRGMTSHARNVGITKSQLDTFNRWSNDMNSEPGVARMDMIDVYTDLKTIKPLLLCVTRAF